MSISDLQAMSQAELRKLSIDQFVDNILQDRIETKVLLQDGDRRGMLRQVVETRDYKSNLILTKDTTWTYWPGSNVRDITIVERDSSGKETSRKVVPHAESGGLDVGQTAKESRE